MARTYRVATAVDVKVGRHGDSTAEVENGVQGVKADNKERVNHERLLDACRDEVEQRQHAEDSDKHVVIDNRRVAGVCCCDHVTDERHDEKSPDELHRVLAMISLGHISSWKLTWKPRMARLTILATILVKAEIN